MQNRIFKITLAFILVLSMLFLSACGSENKKTVPKEEITILYTNDIHSYIDNDSNEEEPGISYAQLAALKKGTGKNVLLVDAGDHIQGSVYGAMDEGQSVLEIMDSIYDLATLGNHEFDYGVERTLSVTGNSKYPYISCNFVYKDTGKPVLNPHIMKTVGNVKIGFVGVTTPETLSSTAPSYFQNEKGEYIYDFLDDKALYSAVQSSVDTLKKEGADYIIALGHVGVDSNSKMTSRKIIENVSGLSAFIDGHSHTELPKEKVLDKDGKKVLLTQTGSYFEGVGKLTISSKGIDAEIIKSYNKTDDKILKLKNEWVADVEEMLGEKIGTLAFPLSINDKAGNRIVRVKSAGISDFVADSYYYYVNFVSQLDCDVAVINGGGVRADITVGEVSYKELKSVNPFGNMLCVTELSGQQIVDMLEWGARSTMGIAGQNEEGAFLHAAGLKYTVDTSVVSTVKQNDQSLWAGAPEGQYRVKDVKIYDKNTKAYVAVDHQKTYRVVGSNFTLINKGDGFEMLSGKAIKDYIVEDYMALAAYTVAFEDTNGDNLSNIASKNSPLMIYENYGINYESGEGDGRIIIK